MGALDFGDVKEARSVADEGASGECTAGDRLEAAFVEGAGAVGDATAAFEDVGEERVVFHALEFAVGGEVGVWVVETDDEAEGDFVFTKVVHPAAAVGVVWEGPAKGVGDLAEDEVFGRDLPDFFQAETIGLGFGVFAEVEFLGDLFCEAAVAAFCEEGTSSVEFHASFEGGFWLPVPSES